MKRNIYSHEIKLEKLTITNKPRNEFRQLLENVKYLGYEVENISDDRKIVITKPGGKFVYGSVKREDFMVWIFNPTDSTLWLISHKDIYNDLELKGNKDADKTVKIIDALEAVYDGEEPDDILRLEYLQVAALFSYELSTSNMKTFFLNLSAGPALNLILSAENDYEGDVWDVKSKVNSSGFLIILGMGVGIKVGDAIITLDL